MINSFKSLSKFEFALWFFSIAAITLPFVIFHSGNPLTLIASLIGVTALIFIAKGNVLGQVLTVIFSIIYAVISYQYRYFGEMITYVGMTLPSAVLSIITWLRHPYSGTAEVRVNKLRKIHYVALPFTAAITTLVFYFILKYFNTANLALSTISITTSITACYLLIFRSPLYALAYAANDIVLIGLWILAAIENISYIPMAICFFMFLLNDLYGFYNWRSMKVRQSNQSNG